MSDLVRAIALWARLVFGPRGSGRHRARAALRVADRVPVCPTSSTADASPRPGPARLPAPRSPYGLDVPLNGYETAMVRPYLLAHDQREERARQRQRRLALVLAADFGIDLDIRVMHGLGVA
ncbi:hypothetical protein Q5762_19935 [Streptomyces sp. P9(2023)]|uniref:hypothetical protein n=1 Tax=Streptomyces sp. P9(2023) TaxID=3064394 RepID=UPI0028F410A8|nr:hypothetical protein [Streptomyces sp. P9(2023)]MDT9690572.1 hypothetical protein [Streptomyces sp. P9(2023)]